MNLRLFKLQYLDMTVTSLTYHCKKYINKFVLLPQKSAVGSQMCLIQVILTDISI